MHAQYQRGELSRPEPPGFLATDPWEDQANYLIAYFQNLWDGENDTKWLLGLYMAKQWLRYLREPQSIAELALFIQALESQRQNQGSGWSDLWIRVRSWITTIEQREHK